MAKSARKRRPLATFTVPMKVQINRPDFQLLQSLSALDVERLSKGSHKIEIGFVKGGCCPHLVRAIVKNGMVTGCEADLCKEHSVKPPKELAAVLEQARRKVQASGKWKPIPLTEFINNSGAVDLLIQVGSGCIEICIPYTDSFNSCILCCWSGGIIPHCSFGPPIFLGPLS